MKTKSIILSGLLLATLGAATTSCEDMMTVEDELHTTNLAPQDTVYQVLGIINRMQSLVDRTVVLGELRADLVDIDKTVAKTSLQEVMENNISTDNEFNQAADYYAVINACNVYLQYVDTAYVSHNKKLYEKEIQAVKVFRAWTYLELAKTYGKVPFILDPVLTSGAADDIVANTSNRADMGQICDYFINELLPYGSQDIESPTYGGSINNMTVSTFFIPVRLMIAELYLWRGSFKQSQADYLEACKYYHDYFNYPGQYITTGTAAATWSDAQFRNANDSYTSAIDGDRICIIPLDTCAYDGTYSDLYSYFNSQYTNNYYVPVVPSQRIREISREQIYCMRRSNGTGHYDTIYSDEKEQWEDSIQKGDLRLSFVYNRSAVSNMYTSQYSQDRQHIMKYATSASNYGADTRLSYYRVYRKNIEWLHFAEALVRAGFPETAFLVLKNGVSSASISNLVSSTEKSKLADVPTQTQGNLGSWAYINGTTPTGFITKETSSTSINMAGIHSHGCGDSDYNAKYVLPKDSALWAAYDAYVDLSDSLETEYMILVNQYATEVVDSTTTDEDGDVVDAVHYEWENDSIKAVAEGLKAGWEQASDNAETAFNTAYDNDYPGWVKFVDQAVLDEEALEGMFEGTRFYDLMRWAMYHGDKEYIATQVAKRQGSANHDERADRLAGGNWYLTLPTR